MSLKALVVEDLPADVELVTVELKRAGMEPVVRRVDTENDFLRELDEFKPDVILSDFSMPSFSGLTALDLAQQRSPDTPFIFVSGTIGEEMAVESLKRGAIDYVLKGNLTRLPSAVRRARQEAADRTARRQAEQALRLSNRAIEVQHHPHSHRRLRRQPASDPVCEPGIRACDGLFARRGGGSRLQLSAR